MWSKPEQAPNRLRFAVESLLTALRRKPVSAALGALLLSLIGDQPAFALADARAFITERVTMSVASVSLPAVITTAGSPTIANLCAAYRADPYSRYHNGEYVTRKNADALMRRLVQDCGHWPIDKIGPYEIIDWHRAWVGPDNHVAMAHALISMLRAVVGYGAIFQRSRECRDLRDTLRMRFKMSKARDSIITAEQVQRSMTDRYNRARAKSMAAVATLRAPSHAALEKEMRAGP